MQESQLFKARKISIHLYCGSHFREQKNAHQPVFPFKVIELTNLGRERRPRLHKTKSAMNEIKAVQLCRKHNLKDLLSE